MSPGVVYVDDSFHRCFRGRRDDAAPRRDRPPTYLEGRLKVAWNISSSPELPGPSRIALSSALPLSVAPKVRSTGKRATREPSAAAPHGCRAR